ncbi:EAL domain-containing protein [Arcobacter sp. FWKO B]|uniref:EAL domain-containing protein n=1 Tax=Arcobacter sp. FWKO B TaxID=2593672 RepID=UPI0018A60A3A|nr:EAL domain-containing protein [Arcobacter sp. FWKO B]QOG11486.1 EAL domain-containing protein [Arcobacter sp. FWKO B]
MMFLKKFLLVIVFLSSFLLGDTDIKEYKIAVLSFMDKEKTLKKWELTAEYLTANIPNKKFTILPMYYEEVNDAIANKEVDFVFTNSAHYVIHQKNSNLFRIATVVFNEHNNFVSSFGGVMVTLASRNDINTIKDIKKKRIAAVSQTSLGGYQAQVKELMDNKINFSEKQFTFTGLPQEKTISLLFEDKVDVAFVRSGLLETLVSDGKLDMSRLKVIHQKQDFLNYPMLLSTKLYPEWPFSAMSHIDTLTIKEVAQALMSIAQDSKAAIEGGYFGWSTPQDYTVVRELLQSLKLPPYEKKLDFTISDIITKYTNYVSILMFIGFVFSMYLVFISIRLYRTKKELEYNQDRLKLAASVYINSQNGVMITDNSGIIEEVNNAFCTITGYKREEIIGKNASILRSGRHDKSFFKKMWEEIKANGYHKCEIYNAKKSGEIFPCILGISTINDQKGNIKHLVGIFTDISQQKKYENELKFLVYHDSLTKLPNRDFLMQRLEQVVAQSSRKNLKFALLTLDLDHFKDINDSYGHTTGDELLVEIAKKLKQRLRLEDSVFRLGGDEFAILLEHIENTQAISVVARDVINILNQSYKTKNGLELRINASIGIAIYPEHGLTAKQIFQNADASLYLAKEKGRGVFAYYSDELTIAALKRVEIETKLRNALIKNELRLYYQPQIDMKSGKIVGAEALIRWIKSDGTVISPIEFIPIAEQTGLINIIGEWVINEACMQVKKWIDKKLVNEFTMAVNISAKQFYNSDINKFISTTLRLHKLDAGYLEIELTESALVEKEEETIGILDCLRAQGVRIALDDFGTGYSSLSYLKKFPLDMIKIDKSFVDDIPHEKSDMEIATTIISIGHTFGFRVLAEGVETQEQLDFLKSQGCDVYQGYFKSKPIPANEFELLLTNN